MLSNATDIRETLEQAQLVAQSAVDRAATVERRATTLGGTVAVAASLTVGGASLALDRTKVPDHAWRIAFALAFALAALMFALSGLYAIRALVGFRKWGWLYPDPVIERNQRTLPEQHVARAAELLDQYSYNWEVSDAKLRSLESSFAAFAGALLMVVMIGLELVVYQL